jgi:hypothetical protein
MVVTPIVALIVVAKSAARRANLKTFRIRSNASRPAANRMTREAPAIASRVFPAAMPSEVATDPAVVTLTRKAPRRMAGHARTPRRMRAASAIPVGGQTAVALGWTRASFRPSLPAAK